MIIKIMKSSRVDFWMCDNVENITVEQIKDIMDKEPLGIQQLPPTKGYPDETIVCSIYEDENCPKPSKPWAISFLKRNSDRRYLAIFDTVAYICNDQGKTIETICG